MELHKKNSLTGSIDCPESLSNGSSNNVSGNGELDGCSDTIPTAGEVFLNQDVVGWVLTAICILCSLITICIFIEEVRFVHRHFVQRRRRTKTIWLLALYTVFSVTSLLGTMIPRSSTLVDLVFNVYLSTCMLQFMGLLVDYFGGSVKIWSIVEGTVVSFNTPPFCCCCVCLPKKPFNRRMFKNLRMQVLQVAIVRPVLMFLAAVLWTNGSYIPGKIAYNNAYIYITVLNVMSSMLAIWGLFVFKSTLATTLKPFSIGGKFMSMQLVLLLSVVPNLIINILVQTNVIPCNELFSSKARGDRIYHILMVILMLPVSLVGRIFYRRKSEGTYVIDHPVENGKGEEDHGIGTIRGDGLPDVTEV